MNPSVVLASALGLALLGAIAALVVTEIRAKRKRGPRRVTAKPAAHVVAREALDVVGRGLRQVSGDCARAGRELPDVFAVGYSKERLTLRLAGSERTAPDPWTADEAGEEWSMAADAFRATAPAGTDEGTAQPYPLAVTLGTSGPERVLVDLARAKSAIAVTGEAAEARKLVRSFVSEVLTGPLGRSAEVVLVDGVPAGLAEGAVPEPGRLRTVASLGAALRGPEAAAAPEPTPPAATSDGTAPGSGTGAGSADVTQIFRLIEGDEPVRERPRAPRLVVLDAGHFVREQHLLTAAHPGDAVLVLGAVPDAGWRFTLGTDGTVESMPLGLSIDTHAGRLP